MGRHKGEDIFTSKGRKIEIHMKQKQIINNGSVQPSSVYSDPLYVCIVDSNPRQQLYYSVLLLLFVVSRHFMVDISCLNDFSQIQQAKEKKNKTFFSSLEV